MRSSGAFSQCPCLVGPRRRRPADHLWPLELRTSSRSTEDFFRPWREPHAHRPERSQNRAFRLVRSVLRQWSSERRGTSCAHKT